MPADENTADHDPKPKTAACPHDTHSLGCHCDKGGPIELDVPPLTGLSAREQCLDLCGELPPEVKQGRLKARMDALVKMASENQTTGQRAGAICATAADLVNNDRNAIYGDAEQNFTETGALWAVVFGHEVTAEQVAICMALVKVARLITTPNHADSWTDGVGYLALGGGIEAHVEVIEFAGLHQTEMAARQFDPGFPGQRAVPAQTFGEAAFEQLRMALRPVAPSRRRLWCNPSWLPGRKHRRPRWKEPSSASDRPC